MLYIHFACEDTNESGVINKQRSSPATTTNCPLETHTGGSYDNRCIGAGGHLSSQKRSATRRNGSLE